MSFRDFISTSKQQRLEAGLLRELRTVESPQGVIVKRGGRELVNFCSNDYLGLANSDELKQVAQEAIKNWGVGAGASHLVCGHQTPHYQLELELAEFSNAEKAIVFSTGYMANLAVPSAFLTRHDLLLQDKLNHASLIDAGLLSRSATKRYRHLDVDHAGELMRDADQPNILLATDGVFSMDGTIADAKALQELCDSENRLLLVDDAHGFGVLGDEGRGTLEQAGVKPTGQTLMIGTLSKAIGGFGAFAAGDALFIDHLIQHARPYIYTTALPPSIAQANRKGLQLLRAQPWRRERLRENIATFRRLAEENDVPLMVSQTPIQSVVFEDPVQAVLASAQLEEDGLLVVAIRPPTVPEGTSRLRITISAAHEMAQIQQLVKSLSSTPT